MKAAFDQGPAPASPNVHAYINIDQLSRAVSIVQRWGEKNRGTAETCLEAPSGFDCV